MLSTHKEKPQPGKPPTKLAVATDIAVFTLMDDELKLLCIRRGPGAFEGYWALPGGFLEPHETLDECAARELVEEAGVDNAFLQQFGVYSAPDRDPRGRVVSIAYLALVRADDKRLRAGTDATDAAWFALTDLPRLAFDHPAIIDDACTALRHLSDTGDIALNLMPESFTMTELRVAHEKIIGGECDRRNFSKRILELDVVEPTGEKRTGPHRPAATYRRKKRRTELS